MAEQLGIHNGCRHRIAACEAHPTAALRIQTYDADRKAMTKGERECVCITAGRLKHHLNIRSRKRGLRTYEASRFEHVAGQRSGAKQRIFQQIQNVPWSCAPGDAVRLRI